jgi:ATP-dependent RNA helicase DDX41
MPLTIQQFAKAALVKPVTINVGRAGSANLNVTQEVEYVKEDGKLVQLLETLKKTGPPVLIFCENKNDVDDIHEYLLLKGVQAVALHGGKGNQGLDSAQLLLDQEERGQAVSLFKAKKREVLVATDVAAKGLHFPDVKHVINYDMPKDVENTSKMLIDSLDRLIATCIESVVQGDVDMPVLQLLS